MAKSMMDLNLGPDLADAQALQHEAEMDMINAHKALMKFYESFGVYVNKIAEIKAEIPDIAFKVEREEYGNTRDKSKISQSASNGSGGAQKPKLHATKVY